MVIHDAAAQQLGEDWNNFIMTKLGNTGTGATWRTRPDACPGVPVRLALFREARQTPTGLPRATPPVQDPQGPSRLRAIDDTLWPPGTTSNGVTDSERLTKGSGLGIGHRSCAANDVARAEAGGVPDNGAARWAAGVRPIKQTVASIGRVWLGGSVGALPESRFEMVFPIDDTAALGAYP